VYIFPWAESRGHIFHSKNDDFSRNKKRKEKERKKKKRMPDDMT
jgi:hypothetical protein